MDSPYYAQCYPGAATAPASTSSSTSSTRTTTTSSSRATLTTPITTLTTSTTTTPSTTTSAGGGGSSVATPTTLESGWYWIRGVASPYFHSYLQAAATVVSLPTVTSAPAPNALLSKPSQAGQFNIIAGQLVWHRFGGQAPLYMHVENPADKTQRKLRTWFEAAENTYGTFAFQGDTLTWSVSDIKRPNTAAWLVCAGDQLFVNTGAFLYQTPEGCYDHTVSATGVVTVFVSLKLTRSRFTRMEGRLRMFESKRR